MGFLVRDVLAQHAKFDAARAALADTKVTAQVYLIIGGVETGEGSVVTRGWNNSDVWSIPNGPQPWFILETNYDHWRNGKTHSPRLRFSPLRWLIADLAPAPDNRRKVGTDAMEAVGKDNINEKMLFGVLQTRGDTHTRGTFNSETQYSVVMRPRSGLMTAYTWQ